MKLSSFSLAQQIHFNFFRFVGRVDFVEGDNKWFGIELDEPLGRHDGTVQDVRYFAALDDHGVFVTESKLTKLHNQPPKPGKTISDEHESQTFSMNYHTLEDSLETEVVKDEPENAMVQEEPIEQVRQERARSKSPKEHKPRPLRRSLSMQHRASKVRSQKLQLHF